MRRWWITLLAALLGAGVLLAAVDANPQVGSAAAARRSDIEAFRGEFLSRDRSYSQTARAQAEARLASLEVRTGEISQVYFELEIARIVALADNGHTIDFSGPRAARYNHVPIRLTPFEEHFYVVRARAEHADLLGARLTAIDNRPIEEIRDIARTLVGGVAGWRDRAAGDFLESPEQMHALGAARNPEAAIYSFVTPAGAQIERSLTGPPDQARAVLDAVRWLFPKPTASEGGAWRTALNNAAAPWSLREPEMPFRWRIAEELAAMVVELRQNNDAPGRPIRVFLREMEQEIAVRRPEHFVLDLRMNGGGDLNTTRDFVQSLPDRVPGRIFVLTSPWTFSAAISTTGYLKQASPERVSIVGEAAGDRLEFFAEGQVVTLPKSQAMILYATERHDYANGCRGFSDCHGSVRRHPIAVPSLAPDIAAPWTIETYLAGADPGMEAVAAALRQGE